MSIESEVRQELLALRKATEAVTVGSLARTTALRIVLGGGDARVAYNALKHLFLESSDSLAITALSYSLGYASDASTHLGRLDDFGWNYDYDQRQARRYSDRGVTELSRRIATEHVVEAAPSLGIEIHHVPEDDDAVHVILRRECLPFVDMAAPVVETVGPRGGRHTVGCRWRNQPDASLVVHWADSTVRGIDKRAISVLWPGEVWPRFVIAIDDRLPRVVLVTTLGARVQLVFQR